MPRPAPSQKASPPSRRPPRPGWPIKITLALAVLTLTLTLCWVLAGCSACGPTASAARLQRLAQTHEATAMDLATAIELRCETRY